MANKKTFIAISSESLNGKLVLLVTSSGESLYDENGIHVSRALDFLFSLIYKRKRVGGVVFVCYAFSRDNEFIFSTLPSDLKDKLFQTERVKRRIEAIELDTESIEEDYYNACEGTKEHDKADFELSVNRISLKELVEVDYENYNIKLANGKMLTITRGGKSLTVYDLFGFFKPKTLSTTYEVFSGKSFLQRKGLSAFPEMSDRDRLKTRCTFEVNAIADLAAKLDQQLRAQGISLNRWHGASALTSYWLTRYKAKDQFHNYSKRRQHAPEYWKAKRQAFYPGRSEQFKLGTLENVNVYDINSAYAYACTYLPCLLHKPRFTSDWSPKPFSCWLLEYDLRGITPYFGLLPNRDMQQAVKYKLRGKSYFWQPEVSWLLTNYPEAVKVCGGFVFDYTPAPFALGIETLYNLRVELQKQGNPLEKVIKLALASLYGKFCQHNGKGRYYNLEYAGFITSLTRMQLLEATKGYENQTVCFQTDAIHTTAALPVLLSGNLGGYKQSHFDRITYLDNGVYRAENKGVPIKTKTRGFRNFDFTNALAEIKDKRTYTGLAEFFIGHNLFTKDQFKGVEYLADYKADKVCSPITDARSAMRLFEILNVDLSESYIDSRAVDLYNGKESEVYRIGSNRISDMALDTIEAGRI